jgi:hypothetical protein
MRPATSWVCAASRSGSRSRHPRRETPIRPQSTTAASPMSRGNGDDDVRSLHTACTPGRRPLGRLVAAGVPDEVGFATKPALAATMILGPLDAGVPAAWVAVTRSTAPTRGCGWSLRPAGWATWWRSPATTRSASAAPRPCRRPGPAGPRGCMAADLVARGPKASAWTAGRFCAWTTRACSRRASRPTPAHGPPQPAHRRAGFLPLLNPSPGAAGYPGPGRRAALDHGDASTTVHSYTRTGCMISAPVVGCWF